MAAYGRGQSKTPFTTTATLDKWQQRLSTAHKVTTAEVRQVMQGERRITARSEAPTRAGKEAQSVAQRLHATYRDKDIAKELGISRQRATAERQKIMQGKADAATLQRWQNAERGLTGRIRVIDGVIVVDQKLAKMHLSHGATIRDKGFATMQQAIDYVKTIGGGQAFARVVNFGTDAAPSWGAVVYHTSNVDIGDDEDLIDTDNWGDNDTGWEEAFAEDDE